MTIAGTQHVTPIRTAVSRGPAAQVVATLAALVCTASTLPAGAQPAGASDGPERARAMIVLDGSNSMNGRLGSERAIKFQEVRDALLSGLDKVMPGTALGLTTFGARRPTDCSDAEVAAMPALARQPLADALEGFQPRGFSPVVLAMRKAGGALSERPMLANAKAGMVIIMDDLASCRGEDPCAVASELKRQLPALAIHVVGLAMKPGDARVMACVTNATGGKFFDAQDETSLQSGIEEALKLVSAEPPPKLVAPAPKLAPRRVAPKPAHGTVVLDDSSPGVHLGVRLTEGGPVMAIPVRWRILRAGSTPTSLAVAEAVAPTLSRQLAVGKYQVEATSGLVTVSRAVEVKSAAAMPVALTLDAGLIDLEATLGRGGPRIEHAIVELSASAGDRKARGKPLWIGRGGSTQMAVPPGRYAIRAEEGLSLAETTVAVEKGKRLAVQLALSAGRLAVEASDGRTQAGGAVNSQFILEVDDPSSRSGRREIVRQIGARLAMTLPIGSYIVTVRDGTAEASQRVAVLAGQETRVAVKLAAVRVRLISQIGGSLPKGLAISYRVERLDGLKQVITRRGEAEPVIELAPGRYRFESRIGAQNAVAAYEAEIKPGRDLRVTLDTGAGSVQLRLAGVGGGLVLGDVFWQIFDSQGRAVWRTGRGEPVLALSAGHYKVTAETRGKHLAQEFDVRPGDVRVLEVGG